MPYYVDLNPSSSNNRGHLLTDYDAIEIGSLKNLMVCPIGDRGRIFQPEYGSILYELLHEPVDELTARRIQDSFLQSIARWEPRIRVISSLVVPEPRIPGYEIIFAYEVVLSNSLRRVEFTLEALS